MSATPAAPKKALSEWPLWEVFVRSKQGLEHKHCGSLHASDAQHALQMARDVYTRRQEGVSIWVVPSNTITASAPDDKAELFDPACTREDKVYSKFTAGLIQQRLILSKREYVPSISAILYQLNTADKPMAITRGSKKMGYYSKSKLIESKKSILKAVVKK